MEQTNKTNTMPNKKLKRSLIAVAFASFIPALSAGEQSVTPSKEPVTTIEKDDPFFKLTADLRVRYEYREQDGLDSADAETFRSRLGLMTKEFYGFQVFGEYEGTLALDRDSYRAGSSHGPATKTVIADPESHELNQAWVSYRNWDTLIKAGRQRIIMDNARFIGNVGWRQNEQTFDAVTISNDSIENLTLSYGYINRVNRIFGSEVQAPDQEDFEGDSHIVNAKFSGIPNATIGTYAYFLDLHNEAGDANSNHTYGAYIDGFTPISDAVKFEYRAEYAYQTNGYDSPLDYGSSYYHVKGGIGIDKVSFGVGYESLGSDNGVGFKTPLATLHAFNGFADKFLGTPGDGLSDLYVYAGAKLPKGFDLGSAYHWFGSEGGSLEYGSEVDFVLSKSITENVSFVNKYAFYFADEFATDTNQITAELNIKF